MIGVDRKWAAGTSASRRQDHDTTNRERGGKENDQFSRKRNSSFSGRSASGTGHRAAESRVVRGARRRPGAGTLTARGCCLTNRPRPRGGVRKSTSWVRVGGGEGLAERRAGPRAPAGGAGRGRSGRRPRRRRSRWPGGSRPGGARSRTCRPTAHRGRPRCRAQSVRYSTSCWPRR